MWAAAVVEFVLIIPGIEPYFPHTHLRQLVSNKPEGRYTPSAAYSFPLQRGLRSVLA